MLCKMMLPLARAGFCTFILEELKGLGDAIINMVSRPQNTCFCEYSAPSLADVYSHHHSQSNKPKIFGEFQNIGLSHIKSRTSNLSMNSSIATGLPLRYFGVDAMVEKFES